VNPPAEEVIDSTGQEQQGKNARRAPAIKKAAPYKSYPIAPSFRGKKVYSDEERKKEEEERVRAKNHLATHEQRDRPCQSIGERFENLQLLDPGIIPGKFNKRIWESGLLPVGRQRDVWGEG